MGLRDYLWDYPLNVKKLYISTTPFSHIILFTFVALLFFTFLFSTVTANYLNRGKRDRFVEGVVGVSERINPLYLTNNQLDRDIQELVFSKFIELNSQGLPVPSVAKDWITSSDSKTYTFNIRDDMYWQDGRKLTADDVVFTYQFAKDLFQKYSLDTFGSAISNVSVEKIGEYQVRFTLTEINATFLETISVYIIPKHVLENTTIDSYAFEQFDKYPLGSGPFYVSRNDGAGIVLAKNPHYFTDINLSTVEFKLFQDLESLEHAFRSNQVDGIGGYSSQKLAFTNEYLNNFNKYTFELPFRKKIIFFNTRTAEFANSTLRRGLAYLIDKDRMLKDLNIDGKASKSSVPEFSWAFASDLEYIRYHPANAAAELKLAGYTKNQTSGFYTSSDGKILSIDLTYLDNDSNTKLVNYLVKEFEREGVLLNGVPKTYEQLTKEVLASRDFDLILYEMEVSIDPDQYNIWHSLKIDSPNLNIAGYKFNRVDIYLERGRQVLDRKTRLENYINFQKVLLNDTPAIFLYEPKYTYIIRKDISGFNQSDIKFPQQRFKSVVEWKFE